MTSAQVTTEELQEMLHDHFAAEARRSARPGEVQSATAVNADRRASDQAIAMVAHDLRGPLANLSVVIELIDAHDRAGNHEKIGQLVQRAARTVDRMDGLIKDVLERMRPMGNPFDFAPGIIDLAGIARDVCELNRPVATRRAVTLDYQCADQFRVRGSEQMLRQAVDNLINNAARHAPRKTCVQIEVQRVGSTVVLTVTNCRVATSSGTPELTSDVPVRPQSSRGTARGLGLWITREIAARHGGELTCQLVADNVAFALSLPQADLRGV